MTLAPLAHALALANIGAQALLLVGVVWSIVRPDRRVYPMPNKNLTFWAMWVLFGFVFASNGALVVLDWNSGPWSGPLRFVLGAPVAVVGAALVSWGIFTLGLENTSAVRGRFVAAGPYLISRNPQYVGDALLFVGISVMANSEIVWVTHLFAAGVLLLAPFAEEPWLEGEYGKDYAAYRRDVPRYL